MSKTEIYRKLEKAFLSTLLGDLIPGVVHNFANPLNGIMGRSKLLQRRLANSIQKLDATYPGFAREFEEDKITRDINTIATEADRLFDIFRDFAGKISTLSSNEPERINLSRMMESEVRFADFYLDFKHDVHKTFQIDDNLPEIIGDAADYSLCISTLINSARERMKNCPERAISISTSHDVTHINILFQDTGVAISENCKKISTDDRDFIFDIDVLPEAERGTCYALLLLKHYGARMRIDAENGRNIISLSIPYR
jgi:signal transduction histidine kinase